MENTTEENKSAPNPGLLGSAINYVYGTAANVVYHTAEAIVGEKVVDEALHTKDMVVEAAVHARDAVLEKVVETKDTMVHKVVDTKDAVLEKVTDTKDAVVDRAIHTAEAIVGEKPVEYALHTVDNAFVAKDAVIGKAFETKDAVVGRVVDTKDAILDRVVATKDAMVNMLPVQTKEAVSDKIEDAKEKLSDLKDIATDKLDQAKEVVSEKIEGAKETLTEAKEAASDKIDTKSMKDKDTGKVHHGPAVKVGGRRISQSRNGPSLYKKADGSTHHHSGTTHFDIKHHEPTSTELALQEKALKVQENLKGNDSKMFASNYHAPQPEHLKHHQAPNVAHSQNLFQPAQHALSN